MIRDLLLAKDYEIIASDEYNWAFAPKADPKAEPVIVPHKVDLVPVEVAFHVARRVGFTDYLEAVPVEVDPFLPDEPEAPPTRVN